MRQFSGRAAVNANPGRPPDMGTAAPEQAAQLMRAYHRQVEEWFVEFAHARSRQRKRERAHALAQQHTQVCSERGA
jgi:hypothetical protein